MHKTSGSDLFFESILYVILALVGLVVIIPVLYTFSVSLTPYHETLRRGGMILWPTHVTFEYYAYVLGSHSPILRAYWVTILITCAGVAVSLFVTVVTAYPLSRKYLPGKNMIMAVFFFTMLFNGGMIPTYFVVRNLHLINSLWALIIPSAMSVYYMIILRTFFSNIPDSLEESARMDGANDIVILFNIMLPLSKPALATFALFYAVSKWNVFFDALIYITDSMKYPLQIVLRRVLLQSQVSDMMQETSAEGSPPLLSLQMTTTVVAILPMMLLYPFLQKYFVSGMMIGAVKG